MFVQLLAAAVLCATPGSKSLELDVGAQKILEVPGLSRVAVGDPEVADVKPLDGKQLLVVGKAQGNTTLLVWTSAAGGALAFDLHVRADTGEALSKSLRALLPADDLRVSVLNGKRVVQGQVLTLGDLRKLHQLVEGDSDVVLMVQLELSAQHLLIERINAELQKAGLRDAKAELVGTEIFLEGHVDDEADAHKAQLIAESLAAAQP